MKEEILKNKNLMEMSAFARENMIPIMLPDTAKLLGDIINKHKPKSVLEIGTAIGYSGAFMLLLGVTELTTIELNEKYYSLAKENFARLGLQAELLHGDAKDVIVALNDQNKKFDLILLDGPKAQYVRYLPTLKQLLNKGGVLFADDVLFFGMVKAEFHTVPRRKRSIVVNLQKYISQLEADPNFDNTLYNTDDGILVSVLKK